MKKPCDTCNAYYPKCECSTYLNWLATKDIGPADDNTCASCVESAVSVDGLYCLRTMPIKVNGGAGCKDWEKKGQGIA